METEVKLTKLAGCAGCGAKVGAGTLVHLLEGFRTHIDPRLIVGYDKSDDASVYVLDENTALVQTTDFFPPIVDDPFLYGQIAAANALSDVYAMGGEPKLALNIMCLAQSMDDHAVQEILRGGYDKAYEAGAIITGGCRADLRTGGFGLRASEKGAHQQRRKAGGCADSDQAARRWRADHSSKSGSGRKVCA